MAKQTKLNQSTTKQVVENNNVDTENGIYWINLVVNTKEGVIRLPIGKNEKVTGICIDNCNNNIKNINDPSTAWARKQNVVNIFLEALEALKEELEEGESLPLEGVLGNISLELYRKGTTKKQSSSMTEEEKEAFLQDMLL